MLLFKLSIAIKPFLLSVIMLSVIYAECHLCWVPFMLSVTYAQYHNFALYTECHNAEYRYAECCGAIFMTGRK